MKYCNKCGETKSLTLCGVKLLKTIENKTPMDTSPSLDRIDNSDELNENNIWIICHQCNATKRNRTIDEFYEYCNHIISRRK
jgi:5-methylcytosine-specific restriction endonuclease McrA